MCTEVCMVYNSNFKGNPRGGAQGAQQTECGPVWRGMDFARRLQISRIVQLLGFEEGRRLTEEGGLQGMYAIAIIDQTLLPGNWSRGISDQYSAKKACSSAPMAFECFNKSVACMQCKDPAPYFKLFRSNRPQHLWVDSEGNSKPRLLCRECELSTRVTEFNTWSPQQRLEDPQCPYMNSVKHTIKRQSKGEKWYETGQKMKVALREIREDAKIEKREISRVTLVEVDELEDYWTVVEDCKDDSKSTLSIASSSRAERATMVLRRANGMAESSFQQF